MTTFGCMRAAALLVFRRMVDGAQPAAALYLFGQQFVLQPGAGAQGVAHVAHGDFLRGLGVALARRMKAEGALIDWVGCVAYALLAGLIARMIILPVGPVADIPLWQRGVAVACGIAAYFLARKNVLVGVLAGTAAVAAMVSF